MNYILDEIKDAIMNISFSDHKTRIALLKILEYLKYLRDQH